MAVNPAIALGVKGIELQDPLAQYGRVAAIQGAQQQNALARMQMGEYERARAEEEGLRNYLTQADLATPEARMNLLRYGKSGIAAGKALGEQEEAALKRQKLSGEVAAQPVAQRAAETKLVSDKLQQARSFLDTIDPMDPNAPEQYLAWHRANHRDPVLGPVLAARGVTEEQSLGRIQQAIQQGPQGLAQLINQSKLGTEKFMELNKPVITQQTLGGTVRTIQTPGLGGAATVVPGSQAAVTMTQAQIEQGKRDEQRIKQEGQRIGLEGRRVAVQEQEQLQKSDPAFQQRMEAARTVGRKAAEGDVAAKQALPRVLTRAEEGLRLIDEMVGKQEVRDKSGKVIQQGTKPHPGFENAVGATWLPGARFVPGTDAADFMSRFDQIKGASFLEAFESLKGGGAITETEGAKATSAINRMGTAQSEAEFRTAARDLQNVIRKGVETAKRRVASPAAGVAPAAAGAVDTNNPLLK